MRAIAHAASSVVVVEETSRRVAILAAFAFMALC
jgi:hypothetical protein